jgi:hypothetical protein
MSLPRLLDAEGGFALVREHRAQRAQFRGAAQHAVDEEAVDHDAGLVGGCGVSGNEVFRHRAGKAPIAAVAVEAQQVVAIGVGLVDPQFADHAAFRQWLVRIQFGLRHCLALCPVRFRPIDDRQFDVPRIASHPIWCNATK